jgi:hypothetical protein
MDGRPVVVSAICAVWPVKLQDVWIDRPGRDEMLQVLEPVPPRWLSCPWRGHVYPRNVRVVAHVAEA